MGYLKLPAPFDGVIVARNANTFDFVLPSTGDPTAMDRAPAPFARRWPRRSTWSTAPTSSASSSTSPSRTPITSISGPRRPCSPRVIATSRSRARVTRTSWALERQEPNASCRDRSAQPQQPASAGDVCVRQGDHRAARRAGVAAGGAHTYRREDLLLEARKRQGRAGRDSDGRQRRRMDRGHQLPTPRRRPNGARIHGRRSVDRNR